MSEKVCIGLLLVGLEGSLEECLEACGSFGCDCCLGHDGGTDKMTRRTSVITGKRAQRLMSKDHHWSDD